MSKYIEVIVIVEGKTEQIFIETLLCPYLGNKNIGIHATQVSKPGQKGGDVRFERVKKDLEHHLKQRSDTYVTTLVDYYGTKEWPGLKEVRPGAEPQEIAETINTATKTEVVKLFFGQQAEKRFIPFIAVHEFETYLFSDSKTLSAELSIDVSQVDTVLAKFGQPEAINNSPETAPSKRLDLWTRTGKFPKTTKGLEIARKTGIEKIREKCPVFDAWLQTFETIQERTRHDGSMVQK
ncbi:MAG: DUF4276 family protein [SAR324 cluster bacterium]|nr:DUF4276 family protein [SAR324 cluster bacterium]